MSSSAGQSKAGAFRDKEKPHDVRVSNITAAKAVADAIRTSLGPRGMDKMIQSSSGDVTITNDGATILKQMQVLHPVARMLVELSKAQDIEAGDGTTTVVVIAGSLLSACHKLLEKGIHPTTISDSIQLATERAVEVLTAMSSPLSLSDRESLLKSATTSLNSKVCQTLCGVDTLCGTVTHFLFRLALYHSCRISLPQQMLATQHIFGEWVQTFTSNIP
ncbi:T-complex protein 1 subunit delta, partial [Geodia barretti]